MVQAGQPPFMQQLADAMLKAPGTCAEGHAVHEAQGIRTASRPAGHATRRGCTYPHRLSRFRSQIDENCRFRRQLPLSQTPSVAWCGHAAPSEDLLAPRSAAFTALGAQFYSCRHLEITFTFDNQYESFVLVACRMPFLPLLIEVPRCPQLCSVRPLVCRPPRGLSP